MHVILNEYHKKFKHWHRTARSFLKRENLDRIMLVLVVLLALSSLIISHLEDLSFADSLWWTIVTLTTVGYGDISPVTTGGRIVAVINMIVGIGVLAGLSATLASLLVEQRMKDDLGMGSYTFKNHIILCEWNYRSKVILDEFRTEPKTKEKPIVLIANIERKPIHDDHLYFVRGHVSDETLERANISKAQTVIILGDDKLDDQSRDAKVVLSTLTVESINPDAHTVVELLDVSFVPACKRANVDEIIVGSELSSRLMSLSALNHGISTVVIDLLSFQGNQLYKVSAPEYAIDRPFIDVFVHMKQTYQSIVVAVQKGIQGEVMLNPATDYKLKAHDYLIIIATEKPQELAKRFRGQSY